ncbi:YHYH protein [Bacteroidia bacterium]|nr:YHYH protein [Bacteroidia bacterium]MDB9882461.1 YHYH protein [Bacteroidia bacterium]
MKNLGIITSTILLMIGFISFESCKNDDSVAMPDPLVDTTDTTTADELAVYKKVYGASDIYKEGNFVVIKVNSLPDHPSPYYKDTDWSDKFEGYNGTNPDFHLNPNRVTQTNYTYKFPLNPVELSSGNQATTLGTIGVAINGVPLFNQYAGPNEQELTNEINSFDQYNGHPQQQGVYHYHIEPLYLTANKGKEALMGFLLDGFPVYGPEENGAEVTNSYLDEFHGHKHATADYPNGIYHYHFTDAAPYLNGDGFKGTPGTATR